MCDDLARGLQMVRLVERLADRRRPRRPGRCWPWRRRSPASRPASTRFSSSSILVETLAPPTTAISGRSGLPSAFCRWSSSASIERPAATGSRCGNAFGRGMGAVRGGEGVVDEDVAQRGELLGEVADRSFPRRHGSGCFPAAAPRRPSARRRPPSAFGPTQSSAKATGRPTALASGARHRLQRHGRHDLALGPVEMATAR